MKRILFFLLCTIPFSLSAQDFKKDSALLKQMSNYILTNYHGYNDLRDLCKTIGHRISGSPQAEQAVQWAKSVLESTGCDKVYLQEVMVPHWVRGNEKGAIIDSRGKRSDVLISSLGNAVGTGSKGIQAKVIQINHIDELKKLTEEEVKGNIVFYNFRFNQNNINTFESYGPCVYYRWGAPSEAAKLGAIGVVIRSVSSAYDDKPHTGSVRYDPKYPSIPAVAIGNTEADRLEKLIKAEKNVRFEIIAECQMLPDVKSYNVIAEMKGSSIPGEIICFGGHLDSWDIGEGAHDDGAGVVQTIEVIRTFKKLGIKPKRTIRAVLFMNEENGLKGALKYAEMAEINKENHILAIESDAGGDVPLGFTTMMTPAQKEKVLSWLPLLKHYGIRNLDEQGGGADIGPLYRKFKTPMMELMPNSQRYFDVHHSANDVFERVHRRELCLGSIAMTHIVYLASLYGM
jgi:carboxypeptidase Q